MPVMRAPGQRTYARRVILELSQLGSGGQVEDPHLGLLSGGGQHLSIRTECQLGHRLSAVRKDSHQFPAGGAPQAH